MSFCKYYERFRIKLKRFLKRKEKIDLPINEKKKKNSSFFIETYIIQNNNLFKLIFTANIINKNYKKNNYNKTLTKLKVSKCNIIKLYNVNFIIQRLLQISLAGIYISMFHLYYS